MAMPIAEPTLAPNSHEPFRSTLVPAERDEKRDQLFGRRDVMDAWQSQVQWVRQLVAPPLFDSDADVAAVTRIRASEITLARLSRTPGRVVISLTDDLAEQIKRVAEAG
jgi:hypothetical protein